MTAPLPSPSSTIAAINSRDEVVRTFNAKDAALDWVRLNPGFRAVEIVTLVRVSPLKAPAVRLVRRSSFAEVARV